MINFRLSERNCVEIIQTLVSRGILSVFHTTDGSEYVTPEQLTDEIRNEISSKHGMRMAISF